MLGSIRIWIVSALLALTTIGLVIGPQLNTKKQFSRFLNGDLQLHIDCMIVAANGAILRSFPYANCQFLPNGSYFAVEAGELFYIDNQNRIRWRMNMNAHHQIRIRRDGKSVLVTGRNFYIYKGKETAFDFIREIDFEGKILGEWNLYENWQNILGRIDPQEQEFWPVDFGKFKGQREVSHLNSIHEIQDFGGAVTDANFQEGNILANISGPQRFFVVISKDLESLLYVKQRPMNIHDLKTSGAGTLLYYMNKDDLSPDGQSRIDEVDFRDWKIIRSVRPDNFNNPQLGAVISLESEIIVAYTNHAVKPKAEVVFHDLNNGEIKWRKVFDPNTQGKDRILFQIELGDYREFIANNRN